MVLICEIIIPPVEEDLQGIGLGLLLINICISDFDNEMETNQR